MATVNGYELDVPPIFEGFEILSIVDYKKLSPMEQFSYCLKLVTLYGELNKINDLEDNAVYELVNAIAFFKKEMLCHSINDDIHAIVNMSGNTSSVAIKVKVSGILSYVNVFGTKEEYSLMMPLHYINAVLEGKHVDLEKIDKYTVVPCTRCGRPIYKYRAVYDRDGVPYCKKCADDVLETCSVCSDMFSKSNSNLYNIFDYATGETVKICGDCRINLLHQGKIVYCNGHGRYEMNVELSKRNYSNIGYVCTEYENDHESFECFDCGKWFIDDGSYDSKKYEHNGHTLCQDCYEFAVSERTIRSYGYKPMPKFYTARNEYTRVDDGTKLFIGVECETDGCSSGGRHDIAASIMESKVAPYVYCKEDCSINGPEIVTHPLEHSFAIDKFDWRTIADICLANECSNNPSRAGMHMHFNRNYLGKDKSVERELAEAKLIYIFDTFYDDLLKFSRRNKVKAEEWAAKPSVYVNAGDARVNVLDKKRDYEDRGYRRSVNLGNKNTIEIRLWSGTLDEDIIKATIDMTQALVKIAKNESLALLMTWTWDDLIEVACKKYAVHPVKLAKYMKAHDCYKG